VRLHSATRNIETDLNGISPGCLRKQRYDTGGHVLVVATFTKFHNSFEEMELSSKLLEEYEFTTPSLSNITDAGHAFSIPWDHQVRAVMAGFDSAGMKEKEGPWKLSSPFELSGSSLSAIVPDTRGGIASFRDGFSTQSGASTEHLSAALGITVGYPFLNASVSGKYDKKVMMNNNVSPPIGPITTPRSDHNLPLRRGSRHPETPPVVRVGSC
jgi:hypothetical protein